MNFSYQIKDALGIHARPAGQLVKAAAAYESSVTIQNGDKKADAKRIMAVMSMGVKCGDEITVVIEGADEEAAADGMLKFLEQNL